MQVHNQHHLIVTGLGSDPGSIIEAFSKTTKQCGANIIDSRLTTLSADCVFFFHVLGTWDSVAKLEAALPLLAQQLGLALQIKRTLPRTVDNTLNYQIQVVAQDRIGILHELALFFYQRGISIEEMLSESYTAKNSAVMMCINMQVNVPVKQHIATLRENFMIYCEERNLDAVMEPYKPN